MQRFRLSEIAAHRAKIFYERAERMLVVFFFLWLVFNGRVTLEIILFGMVICTAAGLIAGRAMGYTLESERRVLRSIPWFFLYAANLIREVAGSACSVAVLALTPSKKPDPVFTEFHSGLEGDLQNVLLANSITLTPGTITVYQEKDFFVIHCLRKEYAEGLADSSFIRLLKKL